MNLLDYLPVVPDFPKPGILFRDISPLLADAQAFEYAIDQMHQIAEKLNYTHILGMESRGFIFGAALAQRSQKGFVMARKPNKLPLATHRQSYGLEYGADVLEIQQNALPKGSSVLLIDDVLATGGTMLAAAKLVAQSQCISVGGIALLEIEFLAGAKKLLENSVVCQSVLKI
jgi:adenine phosphoribosyltransferase